jgi:1,3-propanediol dehydrogenase
MFRFQVKTNISFGPDTIKSIGEEAKNMNLRKVLIVTDRGIIDSGLFNYAEKPLKDAGIEIALFDEIEPNPHDKAILRGAECLKDEKADAVIGLGGGSPMDAAKAISVLGMNQGTVESFCGDFDPWKNPPLPIIAVPTTAGTGSEISAVAMISFPEKRKKMMMRGRSILPEVAICDPCLTLGLSSMLTAWTGLDALSHALEAYVCKRMPNPFSDIIAERAIELVADNLRKAYASGQDIETRSNMLLASSMGVIAALNAGGLGVVHAIAHSIGGYYGLPHGLVIANCLPYGLEYNAIAVPEKYATVSKLMGINTTGMSTLTAAKKAAAVVRDLVDDLDIKEDLASLGVKKADIPRLVENSIRDGSTPANPRTLDPDSFKMLYERMLA